MTHTLVSRIGGSVVGCSVVLRFCASVGFGVCLMAAAAPADPVEDDARCAIIHEALEAIRHAAH